MIFGNKEDINKKLEYVIILESDKCGEGGGGGLWFIHNPYYFCPIHYHKFYYKFYVRFWSLINFDQDTFGFKLIDYQTSLLTGHLYSRLYPKVLSPQNHSIK